MSEVSDADLTRAEIADAEHLDVIRRLGIRSYMLVPLVARGRSLGVIGLAATQPGRYGPADLTLLEVLARRAALAVDNARLYAEAQAANRMKDEFLTTVSHELRTPLAAMMNWVGVLRQGKLSADRLTHALDVLQRSGEAQAKLIEDLLDVSRAVSGRLHLDARPVNLAQVVGGALEAVRPAAEGKGIRLTSDIDAEVGYLLGDPVRLQQVAWNLLANSVKFTPPGGCVTVRVERHPPEARLVVSDTGDGISPEFLPHVFERFRQADHVATRRHGGLGLGLAIVKHLVEAHGGRVEARSDGRGKGAEFVVRLPLSPVGAAPPAGHLAPEAAAG
jgi:signal transduction histidine kinase